MAPIVTERPTIEVSKWWTHSNSAASLVLAIVYYGNLKCTTSFGISLYNCDRYTLYSGIVWILPLLTLPKYLSSPPVFSGVHVTLSLVLCVCFVDRCLSFCTFSFGHCVVCSSSISRFWLPLWYLQTPLPKYKWKAHYLEIEIIYWAIKFRC